MRLRLLTEHCGVCPEDRPQDWPEYDCPYCGGTAYAGDPDTGARFRGSGKCTACTRTFSIVGLKLKPRERVAVAEDVAASARADATRLVNAYARRVAKSMEALGFRPPEVEFAKTSAEPAVLTATLARVSLGGRPVDLAGPQSLEVAVAGEGDYRVQISDWLARTLTIENAYRAKSLRDVLSWLADFKRALAVYAQRRGHA